MKRISICSGLAQGLIDGSATGHLITQRCRRIASNQEKLQDIPRDRNGENWRFLDVALRQEFSTIAADMADEIFDVVNERDEVIDQAPRKEVHARGLWHRAVHVLVFNGRGEVFLQKRSMLKDTAKGKWDSSSSGHLDTGEDYDACAVRELREEIGLVGTVPRRVFKVDARKETGWEFCWVYRCESEGPFVLHPEEIETGGWFAPEFVSRWVAEKPGEFARAFVLIWKRFLTTDENQKL